MQHVNEWLLFSSLLPGYCFSLGDSGLRLAQCSTQNKSIAEANAKQSKVIGLKYEAGPGPIRAGVATCERRRIPQWRWRRVKSGVDVEETRQEPVFYSK